MRPDESAASGFGDKPEYNSMLSYTFEGYLSLFALFRVEEKILWEDLEVFETVDEFDYS